MMSRRGTTTLVMFVFWFPIFVDDFFDSLSVFRSPGAEKEDEEKEEQHEHEG